MHRKETPHSHTCICTWVMYVHYIELWLQHYCVCREGEREREDGREREGGRERRERREGERGRRRERERKSVRVSYLYKCLCEGLVLVLI